MFVSQFYKPVLLFETREFDFKEKIGKNGFIKEIEIEEENKNKIMEEEIEEEEEENQIQENVNDKENNENMEEEYEFEAEEEEEEITKLKNDLDQSKMLNIELLRKIEIMEKAELKNILLMNKRNMEIIQQKNETIENMQTVLFNLLAIVRSKDIEIANIKNL
jgi:hypothetical protein